MTVRVEVAPSLRLFLPVRARTTGVLELPDDAREADDRALVEQANDEDRLLLTQDRRLLMRRALRRGAYVRGARPDEQLADVLDRFRVPLAPYSRCPACNGPLRDVPKTAVLDRLEPGTRRTQEEFRQCDACGRVYWHGAHARRLDDLVRRWS